MRMKKKKQARIYSARNIKREDEIARYRLELLATIELLPPRTKIYQTL